MSANFLNHEASTETMADQGSVPAPQVVTSIKATTSDDAQVPKMTLDAVREKLKLRAPMRRAAS